MERLRSKVLEGESARNSTLVRNLLEKKRLLDQGDNTHERIKTALVMGGGGVRGAFGAGVLVGLEQLGFHDTFDVVVGVSSGAADLAYFLAKQTELGASLWHEDLVDRRFIDVRRLRRVLDLDYAEHIMRKTKPLDQETIRSSRSSFFIVVTDAQTGKSEFIDVKEECDIVKVVIASSAFPIVYNRTISINGKKYSDGSIGNGIPIDLAIQEGCTDILVVLNNTVGERANGASLLERLLTSVYMRKFSSEFRTAMLARHKQYSRAAELIGLHGDSINIGIIAPSEMPISRISQDREKIFDLAMTGKKQVLDLFSL